MADNNDRINELFDKLEMLLKQQEAFSKEVKDLRAEIAALKTGRAPKKEEVIPLEIPITTKTFTRGKEEPKPVQPTPTTTRPSKAASPMAFKMPKLDFDFEKFIGENLINKIGILITVIGVAIGAKYSIDNELISPLTRIILGYLAGIALLGFGMKLKKNYESYSAVLVSGAMAIMYFITFAAYDFYALFPQVFAFGLMVVFTVFTVLAALNYNRQVIAHVGLVGAYAVPFLLSDGSGKVGVLFSYMAILNIGILIIAFKKYWKALFNVAFVLTWLIYASWFAFNYSKSEHYNLALIFLVVFFITFYLIFLAFKILQKKKFVKSDIILLLANSFIFYGLGYAILSGHDIGEQFLGVFTLCNAIVHFVVSVTIYRQQLADRNLFYMVTGLVLVFITMAFPVQLDGDWVTLFWAGEAALLFWIGRTRQVSFYEKLSYPLMILALFSILQDWDSVYSRYNAYQTELWIKPFLNIHFLSAMLFVAAFAFINYLNLNKKYPSLLEKQKGIIGLMSICIPAILVIVLYGAFRVEISNYWDQLYHLSEVTSESGSIDSPNYGRNNDTLLFKNVWLINYTLLFLSIISFVNIKKLRLQQLAYANIIGNGVILLFFLTQGLYGFSELRESYLNADPSDVHPHGVFNIWIRYVSFVFVGALLFAGYQYSKQKFLKLNLKWLFDLMLHLSLLWIISSELLHWMDMSGSSESYKLGLSILWGVYALILVALGIWKKKKYLRIAAIVLFTITLVKLFGYDISNLNTIAKTVVFVSLGVLLLIISFLYNKYQHLIGKE